MLNENNRNRRGTRADSCRAPRPVPSFSEYGPGVDLWKKIVYDRSDTHGMKWGETAMYESGENYLETILRLREKNGTVRSLDIAHELNFSKPSVSRAIGILKEAEEDACRMEHIISEEVFLGIKRFMSEQSL
ncbi:metal-dependent transcriptional regulator [Hungatella hominis]